MGVGAFSLDLRTRILEAHDQGGSTRQQVAERFRVSLGLVKKLLAQRQRTGQIGPQYHRCGRPPKIRPVHQRRLRTLVRQKPDLTLQELRAATGLACALPAIHYALGRRGLTYKKRRCAPANRTVPT